jgi:hypothetical protein
LPKAYHTIHTTAAGARVEADEIDLTVQWIAREGQGAADDGIARSPGRPPGATFRLQGYRAALRAVSVRALARAARACLGERGKALALIS